MNYYKIDRLTGFKFSFAVCVVVLYVFAGSIVLGVTITNCFFYLLFLELKQLWLFFILEESRSLMAIAKKKCVINTKALFGKTQLQ